MKKIVAVTVFLLAVSVFMGCSIFGGSSLSGLYESKDKGLLVGSIEFSKDGTCTIRDGIMGFATSYKYKVQGKTVVIEFAGAVATLSINNNTTLEGKAIPFTPGQIFIKK